MITVTWKQLVKLAMNSNVVIIRNGKLVTYIEAFWFSSKKSYKLVATTDNYKLVG